MDLKSGYPYWAVENGLMQDFPQLDSDESCDVAVIGAGITGALIADELSGHGHDVIVLDQCDVDWGSTSTNTAFLQYEIDTHAIGLARCYDLSSALLAYQSCLRAISEVVAVVQAVGDVDFVRCRADPYRIASRLLHRMLQQGARVFDHSQVKSITSTPRSVRLTTASGLSITAKHAVIAGGYEAQCWLRQRVAQNRSSYAYISDSVDRGELGWLVSTLLWESAQPYLYLRSSGDGRLLVGGEHDDRGISVRRNRLVDRKAAILQRKVSWFPPPLHAKPAFSWADTHAETSEDLPLFDLHPQYEPRVLFAMAYDGNGITYSMLGAGLLRAQFERRPHPLTALFSSNRLGCQ